jgi:hypothetical protein
VTKSYIEHKGYGFSMHDAFLEGVLYLLVKVLKAHPYQIYFYVPVENEALML